MFINHVQAYFRDWNGQRGGLEPCLSFDDHGAYGRYGEYSLHSVFQPLFRADNLQPAAHEALLRVRGPNGASISPVTAFTIPESPQEIVYFDRLCRMVHAINFVRLCDSQGDLFLNVNFRHVLNIRPGSHGDEFGTLLRHCGLPPARVVLEVIESRIDDLGHLDEAIACYRGHGFRVAIDDFGAEHSNFDRLWRLTPDIVKLDRSLIVEATHNPRARRILPKIVEIIHDLGAVVVCEGIEVAAQDTIARDAGVDLLQGFFYARPSVALAELPAYRDRLLISI